MVRIKFRIYKSIVKGRKIPELEKLKVRFTSGSESGLLLVILKLLVNIEPELVYVWLFDTIKI